MNSGEIAFIRLYTDSDQVQAGAYKLKYAAGYSFTDFRQLVFANVRFNDSMQANGTPAGNVYTIGLKWDLSKQGWHMSNK